MGKANRRSSRPASERHPRLAYAERQFTVKMRYVLFRTRGDAAAPLRVGALATDGVHVADISASLAASSGAPDLTSMRLFLDMGAEANAAAATRALEDAAFHVKLADVDLRAPIYDW